MTSERISAIPSAAILFFSAAVGYISLSQEILWMRLLAYATGGAPEVFGHVLGVFLFGIAFGALLGRRASAIDGLNLRGFIAALLIVSAILYYFSVPLIALFREKNYSLWEPILPRGLTVAYILIWSVAFLQGGILTILCHCGIRPGAPVGRSMSWIYLANIVGSTAGPLLTGFVLLEHFTIEDNLLIVSIATAAVGALMASASSVSPRLKGIAWATVILSIVTFTASHDAISHRLLEKLQGWRNDSYAFTIQNRSGIIAVEAQPDGRDTVYGGGMYDGSFNTDPDSDVNGIVRAYFIAALHPQPKEVLEIGLSTGSWARVLADYQVIEKLTIVEINPGYIAAMARYPEQAGLFEDPRLEFIYDDGRRWLRRNPERKFDFILMNTTWHWRSMISNLTSVEFLRLAQAHLRPGGVIYYNTTGSEAIPYTAGQVFKHVVRFNNFVAASDRPFSLSPAERRANLSRFIHDDKATFGQSRGGEVYRQIVTAALKDLAPQYQTKQEADKIITDDNMLTEYKENSRTLRGSMSWFRGPHQSRIYDRDRSWWATLARIYGGGS